MQQAPVEHVCAGDAEAATDLQQHVQQVAAVPVPESTDGHRHRSQCGDQQGSAAAVLQVAATEHDGRKGKHHRDHEAFGFMAPQQPLREALPMRIDAHQRQLQSRQQAEHQWQQRTMHGTG